MIEPVRVWYETYTTSQNKCLLFDVIGAIYWNVIGAIGYGIGAIGYGIGAICFGIGAILFGT